MRPIAFTAPLMLCAVLRPVPAQGIPQLTATLDLTIDGAQFGLSLGGANVKVASDGSMAISEALSQMLVVVSGDGKRLETVGARRGDHLGEFADLGWFGWAGDSLWVADRNLGRLTLFDPMRRAVRMQVIPTTIPGPPGTLAVEAAASGFGMATVRAVYPGGAVLVSVTRAPVGMPKVAGLPLIRISRTGTFEMTFGNSGFGDEACRMVLNVDGKPMVNALKLFCAAGMPMLSPDGRSNVSASFSMAGADSGKYTILRVGEKGDTILRRSYSFAPIPIRREEVESVLVARRLPGSPHPDWDKAIEQAQRDSMGKSHSPIVTLAAGDDGTTWVEEWRPGPGHHWKILDAAGAPVGEVTLPSTVQVRAVSRTTFWGVDRLDPRGEHVNVVRYRIGPG